ncbi:MAG: sulfatase family protein [Thermomicrobiales bacterium]
MHRRALLGSIAGAMSARTMPASARRGQPNIVVILTDDQNRDTLRFMPNLRHLVGRQGTTFENAIIPTPLCGPSRSVLMTGRYAHETGVLRNESDLGGWRKYRAHGWEQDNLFTWLHDAGYHTGLIGKYMNGHPEGRPAPEDIDRACITAEIQNQPYLDGEWTMTIDGETQTGTGYLTDTLNALAVDFIASAPDDQPVLLWLGHRAPHHPWQPKPEDLPPFSGQAVQRDTAFNEADITDKPAWLQPPLLDAAQQAELDEGWREALAMLQSVDDGIAAIVKTLQQTGRLDNTWIFYLTDNGYFFGQHRLDGKAVLYEEAISFPILMRGPGARRDRVDYRLASTVDLAPTIREIVGLPERNDLAGLSLLGHGRRTTALIESWSTRSEALPEAAGLRGPGWVWIQSGGFDENYDLLTDPGQTSNIAASLTPEHRAALAARTAALSACAGQRCAAIETTPLPA